MVEVKIEKNGLTWVEVGVVRFDNPTMESVEFLIDTGATITTVAHLDLILFGYSVNWIRNGKRLVGGSRLRAANRSQIDNCYMVVLPSINIGGYVGYNWPGVTDTTGDLISLFGTDSMKFFNWELNYRDRRCRFSLIEELQKDGNPASGEQFIHDLGDDSDGTGARKARVMKLGLE